MVGKHSTYKGNESKWKGRKEGRVNEQTRLNKYWKYLNFYTIYLEKHKWKTGKIFSTWLAWINILDILKWKVLTAEFLSLFQLSGQQTFSIKSHLINILFFVGQSVPVITTLQWYHGSHHGLYNDCVPIILYY